MISSPSLSLGKRRETGVALVLVLVFIVLIAVLIMAFFNDVSTELVASKSFSASISTRQLSEVATNLVTAQISDATVGLKEPGNTASPILAWASQPGMIRTYLESGDPYRFYKLYSARNMVVSEPQAGFNVNTEFLADTPNNWHEHPAVFTDLNAPIKSMQGKFEYPIVDPAAQKSSAAATDGIEGFEILKGPGFIGTDTRSPADPTLTPNANPAMMPTRWIYVLRDGTLTAAPEPGGDGSLSWKSAGDQKSVPTKDNPIVGRIAFWTDDETAKVNINTASEGTFWDRPWGPSSSASENLFATRIPAQGEYSRYAGHPAMTCLSPVLGFVMPFSSTADKRNYHFLVPRIQFGGTEAGSMTATAIVGQDNERLFASVDELAFSPIFGASTRTTWTTNSVNAIPADRAVEVLSKARFFLTASSRAPDVNLFNKPRIGLWPLQLKERNAKDSYIAFCGSTGFATANEARYYFQRQTSYATTAGTNDGVSKFIDPMPSSCHPTMDWDNIPRNQELYAYLKTLTSKNVPGFGASLKAKYDKDLPPAFSDRDQILTSMVDYIRTQVNSYNTSTNLTPQYDYAPTRRGVPVAGETQLVPLKVRDSGASATTMGFGRFATITEVAVVFQRFPDPIKPTEHYLRAHVVLEPYNPSPGCASWSPHVRYVIKGLEKFRVGGEAFNGTSVDLGFPKPAGNVYPFNWTTARVGYAGGGHKLAYMGLGASFRYFQNPPPSGQDPPKKYGLTGAANEYPFFTEKGALITNLPPTTAVKRTFSLPVDVPLDIEIYSGYEKVAASGSPRSDLLVQTLHVVFPKTDGIPLPPEDKTLFNDRLASGNANDVVKSTDSVRSVEVRPDGPAGGDLRYVSGLADVPAQYFVENPKYHTSGQALAHSLRSNGFTSPGYDAAKNPILVPGATYSGTASSAASGLNGAKNISGQGDFDNGAGVIPDGAYVNKADEGNLKTGSDSYFNTGSFSVEDGITYSPNRQIASAVTFGSLPTGIKATEHAVRNTLPAFGRPWQTLLFTANPSSRLNEPNFSSTTPGSKHPGFGTTKSGSKNNPPYLTVPDHLWLDLFTMPVIEPYAISEPFSTAGRVNLNYQIAPFSHIRRTTGLRAVLRSVKVAAIPTNSGDKSAIQRFDINATIGDTSGGAKLDGTVKGTLYGFQERFNSGDIFRSASQICDISLVPNTSGASYDKIDTFWNGTTAAGGYKRTGDNVRETPYSHIYPRVTTKSNTFTVHMRVQALRKSASSAVTTWKEGLDQVVGEYRGSTTIERYIDAADPALPDYAKSANFGDNLDRHYRFRVVNTKAFVR